MNIVKFINMNFYGIITFVWLSSGIFAIFGFDNFNIVSVLSFLFLVCHLIFDKVAEDFKKYMEGKE